MGNYMIKVESDFQSLFGPWVTKEKIKAVFELKISHGNTVNWGCFQDQQLPSLWQTYTVGKYFKLTDASLGLKPYDCYFFHGDAYVVIMFNVPDNQKEFYLLHIREVMKLLGKQKSITKKDCQKLGVLESF